MEATWSCFNMCWKVRVAPLWKTLRWHSMEAVPDCPVHIKHRVSQAAARLDTTRTDQSHHRQNRDHCTAWSTHYRRRHRLKANKIQPVKTRKQDSKIYLTKQQRLYCQKYSLIYLDSNWILSHHNHHKNYSMICAKK